MNPSDSLGLVERALRDAKLVVFKVGGISQVGAFGSLEHEDLPDGKYRLVDVTILVPCDVSA